MGYGLYGWRWREARRVVRVGLGEESKDERGPIGETWGSEVGRGLTLDRGGM